MVKVWEEHGRWKTECAFSSTGDTWIGFCNLCQVSECELAGKKGDEILALGGGVNV
jgi:hypothetical protein